MSVNCNPQVSVLVFSIELVSELWLRDKKTFRDSFGTDCLHGCLHIRLNSVLSGTFFLLNRKTIVLLTIPVIPTLHQLIHFSKMETSELSQSLNDVLDFCLYTSTKVYLLRKNMVYYILCFVFVALGAITYDDIVTKR